MFEQDRVLVRLQQRVIADADIHACFLSGSYGRRQEDEFSDLDVALVYGDEQAREEGWRQRREFVASVMPYVPAKSFDAGHVRHYLHVALYSNGSKVDYRFETKTSLEPTIWDKDIRVLKDRERWAEQFQAAAARAGLDQPTISSAELQQLDKRFWVMYWDVLRLVLRGEIEKPFPVYVQLLHFTLPRLLAVLPPEESARHDLMRAFFNEDIEGTLAHLHNLIIAYLSARTAVVRRFHLQFDVDKRFENELLAVLQRKVRG